MEMGADWPRKEEGFQLRRDANFLLSSDPCWTAVGAPTVLARNFSGYSSIGRARQGRWGAWDRKNMAFNVASKFLSNDRDVCVPVELLADLVDEDSKLRKASRCPDLPDNVCADLSWPNSCLENLSAGLDTSYPPTSPPLLVYASGPDNGHLTLLRPGFSSPTSTVGDHEKDVCSSGENFADKTGAFNGGPSATRVAGKRRTISPATAAALPIEEGDRLALYAGKVRQISMVVPRASAPPKVFARCDYSATLVGVRGDADQLRRRPTSSGKTHTQRVKRARAAAAGEVSTPNGAVVVNGSVSSNGGDGEGAGESCNGLVEVEKLVFAKRLTYSTCSPYTQSHAAFLDEEFRLFNWHADRGAFMHGSGPLQFPTPIPENNKANVKLDRNMSKARRARNADVCLDYGNHPRVLWMAGQHRAYRIDLREKPSPAALASALNPGVYFNTPMGNRTVLDGGGIPGGRGETPRIRALAVGRQSAYEIFVGAGLHLACMDVRFPSGVVARWDLPQEVDQLRWLPGLPGGGLEAEEVILASGRRSWGFYVNTWASDVPGWRGCQTRLGLDDTSPAASAARRPLTFSLPATPLGEGETRSGGLILALSPENGRNDASGGLSLVHATSAGDVYSQRFEVRRIDGESVEGSSFSRARCRYRGRGKAVLATHRSALFSDRIQSMLPCGDVCLDRNVCSERHPAIAKKVGESGNGTTEDQTREEKRWRGGKTGEVRGMGDSGSDDSNAADSDGQSSSRRSDEDNSRDGSDSGSDSSSTMEVLSQPVSTRKQWNNGSKAAASKRGSRSLVGGDESSTNGPHGDVDFLGGKVKVEHFPVNASALRASAEKVPPEALCTHRHLPPLVELVTSGDRKVADAKGVASSQLGLPPARELRKQNLGDLRQRKGDLADFLLKPRTPEELLAFCRKTLKLEFPPDPVMTDFETGAVRVQKFKHRSNDDIGSDDSDDSFDSNDSSTGLFGVGRGLRVREKEGAKKLVDESAVAAAIVRVVLAWGSPFRTIETGWRPAAACAGYAIISRFPKPLPRVPTTVLCSARNILRGKPSPLLGPGTFGEPFAGDVTVEDVKWLKGQWDDAT